jgi:predicted DsbA family dithiol-disulfide isomerase
MTPTPAPRLEIVVVSDVVCPWCFIGKRQLDGALVQWQQQRPQAPRPLLRWLPFQLNPDLPAPGIPRAQYMEHKFGAAASSVHDRVRAAGRAAGLELQLDRIARQPNTLKAHALIDQAAEAALQTQVAEALFSAFFLQGRDLADDAVLRAIAREAGLNDELIEGALSQDEVLQRVALIDQQVRERGVNGVPLFVIGLEGEAGQPISGAQGVPALLDAMEQAMPA